jgi:hypothetical protein
VDDDVKCDSDDDVGDPVGQNSHKNHARSCKNREDRAKDFNMDALEVEKER